MLFIFFVLGFDKFSVCFVLVSRHVSCQPSRRVMSAKIFTRGFAFEFDIRISDIPTCANAQQRIIDLLETVSLRNGHLFHNCDFLMQREASHGFLKFAVPAYASYVLRLLHMEALSLDGRSLLCDLTACKSPSRLVQSKQWQEFVSLPESYHLARMSALSHLRQMMGPQATITKAQLDSCVRSIAPLCSIDVSPASSSAAVPIVVAVSKPRRQLLSVESDIASVNVVVPMQSTPTPVPTEVVASNVSSNSIPTGSVATTPLLRCPVGDRLQAALRPIVKTVATNTPPGYFLTEEEGQGLAMQEREMDEWKEDREEVMEEVVRLRKMRLRYYTLHELIVQGPDHE